MIKIVVFFLIGEIFSLIRHLFLNMEGYALYSIIFSFLQGFFTVFAEYFFFLRFFGKFESKKKIVLIILIVKKIIFFISYCDGVFDKIGYVW